MIVRREAREETDLRAEADNTGGAEAGRVEGHGHSETGIGQHLQELTEYAMDIIMVIDADAAIKYVNRASQRLLGYAPQDMIGTNGLDFIHPDEVEWTAQLIARAIREPEYSKEHFLRVRHADGSWRHLQGIGRNLLSHPDIEGIVLGFRDLTERLLVEEKLRDSEELHRTLVRISPDAVTITDLQGKITFVSPLTLAMYGYESEEELLGKHALTLIDPPDRDKARSEWRKAMRGGTVWNVELTALRKGGERFTIELNGASIRDVAGEPRGLVGFSRDITERKNMERELRRRNVNRPGFTGDSVP